MDEPTSQHPDTEPPGLVPGLGDVLGRSARADMVYGEPVHREGITIVPVAKVRYGFGGGGHGRAGAGGGGGAKASPLGYIEIRDGESCYRPIDDPATHTLRLALGGVLGLLAFRALAHLLRR